MASEKGETNFGESKYKGNALKAVATLTHIF
jgi:hypothetical protein